jgi:hypothetical protein
MSEQSKSDWVKRSIRNYNKNERHYRDATPQEAARIQCSLTGPHRHMIDEDTNTPYCVQDLAVSVQSVGVSVTP